MSINNLVLNKVPIVIKKKSSFSLNQHVFRDTIIYDSKEMNFFKEKYQRVTLFNRQNVLNNSCRLIAKIETLNGEFSERTSDEVVKIIGQEQFEVLFMALCSIINQEIRIRGLISILTTNKAEKSVQNDVQMKKVDAWCQTDETRLSKVTVNRKRRMRRQLVPYVVQDFKVPEKIKKVVVDITTFNSTKETTKETTFSSTNETTLKSSNEIKEIPDLGYLHDDNSNSTITSNISAILKSEYDNEILINPEEVIKKAVDEHTNKQADIKHEQNIVTNENSMNLFSEPKNKSIKDNGLIIESIQNSFNLMLPDNTSIMLPKKPEDHFHIATEETLKGLDDNSRRKLIEIQRIIDLKFCLTPVDGDDDEGNLPIHMAVLNEDIHLLKRQCFMLNLKETSVDIEANGLTPLKLSLFKDSVLATSLLLTFGADPLWLDKTHSTYFHTAAELDTEHLTFLLQYCNNNARSIILRNAEFQLTGWEEKSDDELASYLMDHICSICDSQGYTPLMLATNLGLYNNVRSLLTYSPTSVNTLNPTTGNTTLYIAVVAACNVAAERNNKSKLVDRFRKTIEILLDYGADPTIDNYSGSNISVLLTDFQCPELSTLIANRGPASKYNNIGSYNSLMFTKETNDSYDNNKKVTMQLKNFRKITDKPVILESIVFSKSNSDKISNIESDSTKYHNDSNSAQCHTDSNSTTCHTDSNSTKCHTDSTETNSNSIKIENDINNADLTKNQADCFTANSIFIKPVSDSIENRKDSNLNHADSIKTYSIKTESGSTKYKLSPKVIKIKKLSLSTTNAKSNKVSSNNIIVDKPDKIILTPVKLMDVVKSNSSIKRIDSSIDKIDSSIEKSDSSIKKMNCSINPINKVDPAVIIESTRNIKTKNTQNSRYPNITFADYNPNSKSNEFPTDIRFLYTPTVLKKRRFMISNPPVVSIPKGNHSISQTTKIERSSVPKAKPKVKVYIKKKLSTKTSIKEEIDSDSCEVKTTLNFTNKRKLNDSESE